MSISSFSTTFKCDLISPKTPDEWTDMPALCSMSSYIVRSLFCMTSFFILFYSIIIFFYFLDGDQTFLPIHDKKEKKNNNPPTEFS